MTTKERWAYAQKYERSYWQKTAERIASGASLQLGWYEWKSAEMEKRIARFIPENQRGNAKILEVGSGPIGIATYLTWGQRHTIDPLEDFYASNSTLSKLRNPAVKYGHGTGEKLPFSDNEFNLVILDNVLDHVHQADEVLREINRVLRKDGYLYLAVNLHTVYGGIVHKMLSKLRIDKGHPYTFTKNSIRRFITKRRFKIEHETINDYIEAREQDRKSSSLKDRLKGYTGLSEFIYFCVCTKTS